MTTTTSYGSWASKVEHAGMTLEGTVCDALADAHFVTIHTEAIIEAYREAIAAALPDSVSLCGDEFYGPAYEADCDFDGFDLTEDGSLDINAIICAIDFYQIAERVHRIGVGAQALWESMPYLTADYSHQWFIKAAGIVLDAADSQ